MTRVPRVRIGTRKSRLAQVQSWFILDSLTKLGLSCELVVIESEGDTDRTTPLYEIETDNPGLFTKQLEAELVKGTIDLAVHSLKDLPTEQPPSLQVTCIPKRASSEDCLIISKQAHVPSMPLQIRVNASVGTSSLRREAQLLSERNDLGVAPIRGNVPTRVDLVREGKFDAVVLAVSGIERLSLPLDDLVVVRLDPEKFISAPGQGALAVETRKEDMIPNLMAALMAMHDSVTAIETGIERRILKGLLGGCTLPLGVRCTQSNGKLLKLNSFLGVLDINSPGRRWVSFERFDICEAQEETLVTQTVDAFRRFVQRRA